MTGQIEHLLSYGTYRYVFVELAVTLEWLRR
jgi:hypothetical protein